MSDGPRRRAHMANAEDITRWAEVSAEAPYVFPSLVRRLIRQTNDQVTTLQMRAFLGARIPGYDGVVEAARGTPFVPLGRSVWELGSGRDPAAKANSDFNKRTKNPLGETPAMTTFVFVTSQRWPEGVAWAQKKRAAGPWKDVRVLDIDNIDIALEEAPAALQFISEELGKTGVAGVQTIERWWRSYSTATSPELTPELVLAGRADQAAGLLRILEQECQTTTVASASTDDVLAFVAATVMSSPDSVRTDLAARTLVILDPGALRQLESSSELLILLPFEEAFRREAQLITNHHVVFLAYDGSPADIELPLIESVGFQKRLEEQGVTSEEAFRLAGIARQSVTAFYRAAANRPAQVPIWQQQLESRVVRRAWLAGAWNERRSGDQEALTALLSKPYEDALDELRSASEGADPLFTVVGDSWSVSSIEESWRFAGRRLTNDDLTVWESAVQVVLGAVDPALDLPPEERWLAEIRGKAAIHSGTLRQGLACTMAFLSTTTDPRGTSPAAFARATAGKLLQRAQDDSSAQLWISLTDVLPLLAEAAPDEFLRSVEESLDGEQPPLGAIFVDDGGAFTSSSPHTGLLWALERVAWSADYAPYALRLLARLAEIDPGGRLSNRPANSLVDILKPWLPQTALTADQRYNLLVDLFARHEAVAWRLALRLLPESHAIGQPVNHPRFRLWHEGVPTNVSRVEYWNFIDRLLDLVLDRVGRDGSRWADLIEKLTDLAPPQRERLLEALRELATDTTWPEAERTLAWKALSETARQHRAFADAVWALPANEVEELEALAALIAPTNAVDANRWLFDDHVPDLPGERRDDFANYERLVLEARTEAARLMCEDGGMAAILGLAVSCQVPYALGYALANASIVAVDNEVVDLLDKADSKLVDFARGFIRRRLRGEET